MSKRNQELLLHIFKRIKNVISEENTLCKVAEFGISTVSVNVLPVLCQSDYDLVRHKRLRLVGGGQSETR